MKLPRDPFKHQDGEPILFALVYRKTSSSTVSCEFYKLKNTEEDIEWFMKKYKWNGTYNGKFPRFEA